MAVRLQKELARFTRSPTPGIHIAPEGDNLFIIHFVFDGPTETPYEGGQYWGSLQFPATYPMSPPVICMHTPSGRFKINMPICLSMSSFHPESWVPTWNIVTIVQGIQSFMTSEDPAVGAFTCSAGERKQLAADSRRYNAASEKFTALFPDGI